MINIHRFSFLNRCTLQLYHLVLASTFHISYNESKPDIFLKHQQQTQSQIYSLLKNQQYLWTQQKLQISTNSIERRQIVNVEQSEKSHYQQGNILMRQGKYHQAVDSYNKAWKINKNNLRYCIRIAICLLKTNNFIDAIKILQRQVCNNLTNQTIYHLLAVLNFHIENYRQSIQQFIKCYQINTLMPPKIIIIGKELFQKGLYDEALLFYLKIYIHLPLDKTILRGLKDCFIFGQKVSLGKEIYSILHEMEIHKSALNYSLALFNFQIGNIKESKVYLQSALRLDEDDFLLNTYLATVYLQEEDTQQAIFYYKKAFNLQPNNITALNSLAMAYTKQKEYKEARSYYLKSIDLDGNNSIALSGLGIICFQQRDIEEGIKYLEKAIQVDQFNYAALQKLGNTYLLLGKQQAGKKWLQRAQIIKKNMQN